MRTTTRIAIALGLAAAALAGAAPFQPPAGEPPPPSERRREEPRVETREQLTARLQARLDRLRSDEERLVRALDALAAGKPVEDEAIREGADVGRGRRVNGPGAPGGRPGERPGGGAQPDRERVLAFIREHLPEIHRRLETLRERDPAAADRFTEFLSRRARELMGERDPDLRAARIAEFKHGVGVFDASRRYGDLIRRAAPEAELDAARRELRPLLAEQFDLRLKVKQLEVVAMERRLEKLRAEVEGQSSNRDQAVEDGIARIEKLARERPEGHGAPTPGPPPHR